ncbi:MAG: hypothetical protein AABW59_05175 [archaeon]
MNSLEALIAMCALLAAFAVMIGAITSQKDEIENYASSISAKFASLKCASVADSIYSNSAKEYLGETDCFDFNGKVASKKSNIQKSAATLPKITKSDEMEVETLDHYLSQKN